MGPEQQPPLGGWRPGITLTATRRTVFDAVADRLIPGGHGFPAPSEVDVTTFMTRYIAPDGIVAVWYPFLAESDVTGQLDRLGEATTPGRRSRSRSTGTWRPRATTA